MQADQVPVHVDPGRSLALRRGGLLEDLGTDLARVEVAEDERDLVLVGAFRYVDAEGVVLDETTVLSFGRLVRAEPAPLGRVQVARLEVRLAAGERARDPPKVGDRGHMAGPVQQLAHAGPATDPVAGREGVHEALGEQVRPDRRRDPEVLLPGERTLELVFEILQEHREGDAEEILHEVAGELEALVRVVVLVVLTALPEVQFEYRTRHPSKVEGLLETVRFRVAEVGKERAVEDAVDLPLTVLLGLPRGELLLEVEESVLGGE